MVILAIVLRFAYLGVPLVIRNCYCTRPLETIPSTEKIPLNILANEKGESKIMRIIYKT